MATQATMTRTTGNDPARLRRVLLVDATTSGAMGVVLLLAAGPLEQLLGLSTTLLRWVGVILIPFAALLVWVATREGIPAGVVRTIVGGNVLWVVASVLLLLSGLLSPTVIGELFVVLQAAVVLGFAYAEHARLRGIDTTSHDPAAAAAAHYPGGPPR